MQIKTKRQEHNYTGSTNWKKGLLTNIELLYKEKDGSLVVFIEGRSCVPKPPKDIKQPNMLMARLSDFLDVDRMKVELIGKEDEIKKLLHYASKWGNNSFKILGLQSMQKENLFYQS